MEALAAVNVSMGLMLEQTTPRCISGNRPKWERAAKWELAEWEPA